MNAVADAEMSAASRRLQWRCRRGMLELDLLFTGFVNHELHSMTEAQMEALDRLLDLPDNDLWSLLLTAEPAVNDATQQVIEKLRNQQAG